MEIYLETERLVLRRLREADVDNLVELDSDPDVMRYLSGGQPTPRGLIETTILPKMQAYYDQYPGFGYWAAVERSTDYFVGWFSLRPVSRETIDQVDLGYRLRRAAWGQGYATEGAGALMRKAFTELGVQRVVATTYEENTGSRRVMEKLGMSLVRTFRFTVDENQDEGTFHINSAAIFKGLDVEYALDKSDWERRR